MMTEEEFRQAFQDVLEERMDAALAEYNEKYGDEPHVFSAEHEAKMRALFDRVERRERRRTRTRVALVAAACAFVVLTCSAFTYPLIRESAAGFFVQTFKDHVEYTRPAVTKESIEEEYGLVPVPYGFEITEEIKTDISRTVTYSNDEQDVIMLRQSASQQGILYVDNEHGEFSDATIGELQVRLYMGDGSVQASWIEDGYFFSLSCNAPIDRSLFEELIASVDKL